MLPVLSILFAVSLGLLLIVAANVANLLLARATLREKEIAIRLGLGAGRARLIRQLLIERLVLSGLGGALGGLVANWGTVLFKAFLPPTYLPIGYEFAVDGRTLLFTVVRTLVTGVIFGLVPALQSSRLNLSGTLKGGGRTSGTALPPHRLRSALVVAEVALALVLLVGAGLCLQGARKAQHLDLGFDPHQVLLAGLRVGMDGYDEPRALVFYRQTRERLAALPGVKEVAMASWFPLGFEGGGSTSVAVPGYDRKPNEDMDVPHANVSPRYFAVLKIPLVAGRDFTDRDDASQPRVTIINETMAERFWSGQDPVGRKFTIWAGQRELTIIGVAKSGKYRSLSEPPKPFMSSAYQQGVWDLNLGVALRTEGNPATFASALRDEIRALDPGIEVWNSIAMTDFVAASFMARRIVSTLLAGLGAVALVLAALGLYGVLAYVVSQRAHEIGIRLALGASAPRGIQIVLSQGIKLTAIGLGIGLIGAVALSRSLTSFLYGFSPFDLLTFAGVLVALAAVSLAACLVPAWRAARVDPMTAPHSE